MGYQKDSDGRWHQIIDQSKGSSCGPTCIRMVLNMAQNRAIGEEHARQMVERHEGIANMSSITSEQGGMGQMGDHNWGAHGARASGGGGVGVWEQPLVEALKAFDVKEAHAPQIYARQALLRTSVKNPGIAAVGWNAGWNGKGAQGSHWIVVAGRLSNGNVLVLDPIYGVGEIDLSQATMAYHAGGSQATFYNNKVILTSQ